MSRLSVGAWVMPAAAMGGENPLAPLHGLETASAVGVTVVGDEDYPDRGREGSILPYRVQDQYGRKLSPRAFKTAVLENEHLRATFLLELGGRLWSLFDKDADRELLFVNPVFQPANLAIRDAWFSGGVEWNISVIGHSAFTCAPLFAARVVADDGTPVLRLYEWDRVRRVPFQIDCWLPGGSRFLFTRVRIINPHGHAVPMYWWSNIAVPEAEGTRVVAPAEAAFRHDYDGRLVGHDVPNYEGVDVTYTTNRRAAADLYFRIPEGRRKWIAAVDREGRGLVQTSTDRLCGRKMFNWGVDSGGRRWQEFLSVPGKAYIEIQGGLATTQGEYVSMAAGAEWSWVEAYGGIEVDAVKVHGEWRGAYEALESELGRRLAREVVDGQVERFRSAIADRDPVALLHMGSGWGALERVRRERGGERAFASTALPFPDCSIGEEQMSWVALLERGELPGRSVAAGPGALMVQPEWREMLEASAERTGDGTDWLTWYHLGVMRYRAADLGGAREAWLRSIAAERSAWAYRDLAVVAREEGRVGEAIGYWLTAAKLGPGVVGIAIECVNALLSAKRFEEAIAFIEGLAAEVRGAGRIRLARAVAALGVGDLDTVRAYFEGELDIANVREKETVLSDLWFGYHELRVARERGVGVDGELRRRVRREFRPPRRFDFRLNVEVENGRVGG